MIELKNISITEINTERPFVKDFSFNLNNFDKVAIIGEEGNGKSTLIKFIYDSKKIEEYCNWSGNINRNNAKIGYLEQSLSEKWDNSTVEEFFLKNDVEDEIDYSKYNTIQTINNILNKLSINSSYLMENKLMGTLSGGEKVKIQLAKLIYLNPDVMLLDEPTNDLDIETLKWLEEFIKSQKIPVMFISHDETLLENTANIIIHLEQLKRRSECKHTIEKINYISYVNRRNAILKKTEQIALKQRSEFKEKQDRFMEIYQKVEHQQNTISRGDPHGGQLLKKKMKTLKSQEKRFAKEQEDFLDIPDIEEEITLKFNSNINIHNDKNVLDLNLNTFKLYNDKLLSNIKLNIIGAKKITIIGKNGIGKTTLLKYIYLKLSERNDLKVGYMPQNYLELMNQEETAINFISNTTLKSEITRIRMFMGNLKFTSDEMLMPIKYLSGGQKIKLYLLKMVLNEYNVLVLDEPTRNLSPLSNPVVRQMLKEYGGVIISVSHDRKFIREISDTIYELKENGLFEIKDI